MKFNDYIEAHRDKYLKLLPNQFSYEVWKELSSFTLTSIQLFNRKRAGEIERMIIEDFNEHHQVNESEINSLLKMNNDTFDTQTQNAQEYARFVIRGKKARGVPVLLSKNMLNSVKLILSYRENAGVLNSNPYVFGTPGNSTVHTHLSACNLMRRFANEAGVDHPELLRGTQLRKHLATQSALLNLDDCEVSDLANFMGHAEKIHKDIYRLPLATRDIARVSQILEIGVGRKQRKNTVDSASTYCFVFL